MPLSAMPSRGIGGVTDEAHAPVSEVNEAYGLDTHDIRVAAIFKGLNDEVVGPGLVENAAELKPLAVGVYVSEAVTAAGAQMPVVNLCGVARRAEPLLHEVEIRVGPVDRRHEGVEVP